ncbi:MAG: YbaK/EbsC family protein [Thermomicrobiales bacterium]
MIDSLRGVQRLRAFLTHRGVEAEILLPGVPMPTVPTAAAAIGVTEDQILKSLLFVDGDGQAVLVVASGVHRVDRAKLAAASGLRRPRMADPETVLRITGYPAGGVAPVGHATALRVLVDRRTALLPVAYGGAGAEEALVRISPAEILRLTGGEIADLVDGSA